MTDFSDVRAGDRVRLTLENGDLAEFRVAYRETGYLTNGLNSYDASDGWSVEILDRPIELPTKHLAVAATDTGSPYILMHGTWYNVYPGAVSQVSTDYVREAIQHHGFKVQFEGVEE